MLNNIIYTIGKIVIIKVRILISQWTDEKMFTLCDVDKWIENGVWTAKCSSRMKNV